MDIIIQPVEKEYNKFYSKNDNYASKLSNLKKLPENRGKISSTVINNIKHDNWKLIFEVLALLVSTVSSEASGVFVNSEGFLEMTEVIQVPNLSKSELFDAVLENLNLKASGQSANFIVAGSSQENGNVDVNGRLYLGYYKPMESVVFGGGLDVWAHYKMLVRCKDGSYVKAMPHKLPSAGKAE